MSAERVSKTSVPNKSWKIEEESLEEENKSFWSEMDEIVQEEKKVVNCCCWLESVENIVVAEEEELMKPFRMAILQEEDEAAVWSKRGKEETVESTSLDDEETKVLRSIFGSILNGIVESICEGRNW